MTLSPEDGAGALSRVFFWWGWRFFQQASQEIRSTGALSLEALPPVPAQDSPTEIIQSIRAFLEEEQKKKRPSLLRVLYRLHRKAAMQQMMVMLVYVVCSFATAALLRPLALSIKGDLELSWGYAAVGGVAAMSALSLLVQQHSWSQFDRMSRHVWLALVAQLCRKPAHMTSSTFQAGFSEAEVLSMIGQDAPLFPYQFPFMFMFIASPLLVLGGSAVLFVVFKEAFISGFVVCVVCAIACERAAGRHRDALEGKFKCADQRTLVMEEAMHGMHYIKLCNWEDVLERRVAAVRAREMRALYRVHAWYSVQMGLAGAIPILATVSTFLTHAALNRDFESSNVLVALGCFEIMATAFLALPTDLMYFKTFALAVGRMGRLIMTPDNFSHLEGGHQGLHIEHATFQWDSAQEPALKGISLKVQPGELVTVVGRVASGKTSLAASAIGLCNKTAGQLQMDGRCAYVPQHSQTMNATLRDNILFGEPYDKELYKEVLVACHLARDVMLLKNGELTEIGEKGVTMSRGQRARLGLARAAYSHPDVAVLDDPLSAMDSHVGREVFTDCIQGCLSNKGCAVLLITNQLQYCEAADRVVVLDEGKIVEQGTCAELLTSGRIFPEMYNSAATKRPAHPGPAHPGANFQQEDDLDAYLAGESNGPLLGGKASGRGMMRSLSLSASKSLTTQDSGISEPSMQTEKVMEGRIGMTEFMRISHTGDSKLLGAVFLLFCVAVPLLAFGTSLSLISWTAKANEEHSKELLMYLVAGGLYAFCIAGRTVCSAFFFARVSKRLHKQMVAAILRQCMSWYDTTPVGRIMNRISQDMASLDLMVPRYFEWYLQHTGAVTVGILGSAALVWPSLVVMLPILYIVWRLHLRYGGVALELQRLMLHCSGPMMAKVDKFFSALDTIRAFKKEQLFESECQSSMSDVCRVFYWIHSLDRVVMTVAVAISVPALILFVGMGTLLLKDYDLVDENLGALGVALCCGVAMRLPLLMWTSGSVEKFMGGAQCVCEYAELEYEGREQDWVPTRSLTPRSPRGQKAHPEKEEDWPVQGSLVIEDLSLRYRAGLPLVLSGLNLTAKPGERLGICGRTGSGKSTLFLACFRLIEAEAGSVTIDGKPSFEVPLSTWRRRLAIVPQDPLIFSGSVRFNLDMHGRHTDDEIWAVLRQACLEDQLKQLEHGLDEQVQEQGSNFSAGTVQLLSIARVFLGMRKVSIIFLDECTSNIDYATDSSVQNAVQHMFSNTTVICIAHRIQTLLHYDRVALLNEGSVAEEGAPNELLTKKDGLFAELAAESGCTP